MRSPEQVRWDFVRDWLRKADSDLQASRVLADSEILDYGVAAFHAQQAVEKAIKPLLVRYQVEFGKTDDLQALADLVRRQDPSPADGIAEAAELTAYAVEYRYPGIMSSVGQVEGRRLAELATRVHGRVVSALGDYLGAGRPPGGNPPDT
ncbi:MAG: HEPN domain-containing protein [Gemmatimonadota bacterium]